MHVCPWVLHIYVYSIILDGGADLDLYSKVDSHQAIQATTVRMTVQQNPQKILQPIKALDD